MIDVENWLQNYDNPKKVELLRVRDIMLAVDPRLSEAVKWGAPTFVFNGNLATFNPRAKQHVSLVFHTGGTLPEGTSAHWEGDGPLCRTMKFTDMADVEAKANDLAQIVRAWIAAKIK